MTAAASLTPTLGHQTVTNSQLGVEVAQSATGYVPLQVPGTIINIIDPFWGGGEAIRLRVPAGTAAIPVGGAAVWSQTFAYAALPNTANLGQPVAFAVNAVPLNAGFDQFAWFYVAGSFPAFSAASVAINAQIGIVAAGQLGAVAAGKQILNVKVNAPATNTVVKTNCNTRTGSPTIQVTNSDGWFIGLTVTGTGIPATTTITAIDAAGTLVTLSNNATITGSATLTGTYTSGANFWNVLSASRPLAQGQIT